MVNFCFKVYFNFHSHVKTFLFRHLPCLCGGQTFGCEGTQKKKNLQSALVLTLLPTKSEEEERKPRIIEDLLSFSRCAKS